MGKILIVLSGTSGGVWVTSSVSVVGAAIGIARASFSLSFFFNNSNNQEITEHNKKQKKHFKILVLAKSKLNSIETLVSQALIDMEISNEEFITILKEKVWEDERKCEKCKWKKGKYKLRINSVNSRTYKKNSKVMDNLHN